MFAVRVSVTALVALRTHGMLMGWRRCWWQAATRADGAGGRAGGPSAARSWSEGQGGCEPVPRTVPPPPTALQLQSAAALEEAQLVVQAVCVHSDPRCQPVSVAKLVLQQFTEYCSSPSISAARKLVRRGRVHVGGAEVACSRVVQPGEEVWLVDRTAARDVCALYADPNPAPLQVLYEDECMAAVVKPQGLPMQGALHEASLQSGLPHVLQRAVGTPGALPLPQHVHRLDRPTGGVVLVAKTHPAQVALGALFAQRRVRKTYVAIVHGRLEGRGTVARDVDGKAALTEWRVVRAGGGATEVELTPHTGRSHQLRQHLLSLGHPIVGDATYCPAHLREREGTVLGLSDASGMLLWARTVTMPHPDPARATTGSNGGGGSGDNGDGFFELCKGTLTVTAPPPAHFLGVETWGV